MTLGLFRLRLPDGSVRLARGEVGSGPGHLMPPALSLDDVLSGADGLENHVETVGGRRTPTPMEEHT